MRKTPRMRRLGLSLHDWKDLARQHQEMLETSPNYPRRSLREEMHFARAAQLMGNFMEIAFPAWDGKLAVEGR